MSLTAVGLRYLNVQVVLFRVCTEVSLEPAARWASGKQDLKQNIAKKIKGLTWHINLFFKKKQQPVDNDTSVWLSGTKIRTVRSVLVKAQWWSPMTSQSQQQHNSDAQSAYISV